ncbi:MAG: YqaJ viral recombinase family nuclease, partial [Methylotenera sp.]
MKRSNAVRLVSTKNMSREEWLSVRGRGVGSSDAAVAVGLSPYKSPLKLWLEKTDRQLAPDLAANDAVFWGTTLEHIIATVYAERTGVKVRRLNAVLQHPEYPFMLANLDRVVQHPTDGNGILEVKTAGVNSARFWEDGVPESYQCQVLHQLAVTGKAWCDVAVLIGGQDFRVYRVVRDEEKIADLIEREVKFWQ